MPLAIFDLDHTILEGDCDQLWGDFLSQQRLVDAQHYQAEKNRFYQDYLDGQLDMSQFLRFCANTLAQFSPEQLIQLAKQFEREYLKPNLRPAAIDCIKQHQARGDTLLVITATNHFLASTAIQSLGIPHLIASELECIDGRFTGRILGTPSYRDGKILRLEHWLEQMDRQQDRKQYLQQDPPIKSAAPEQYPFDLSAACFYSDSHNDLPLLQRVGKPIVVTPDSTLKNTAIKNGWPILDWGMDNLSMDNWSMN